MAGIASILNTVGPIAMGGAQAVDSTINNALAMLQNAGRYNQGMGIIDEQLSGPYTHPLLASIPGIGQLFQQRTGQGQPQFVRDLAGQIMQGYQQQLPQQTTAYYDLWDKLNQQYGDRYARNMDYLNGAGEQERRDINTSFDNQAAATQSDMISRGLTGTNLLQSNLNNVNRNRADALGGLEERLRGQRIATDAGLTGDWAQAQERLGGNAVNANNTLFQNFMQQKWNLGTAPLTYQNDLLNNKLNWIGNRVDAYPDRGLNVQLMSNLGSGMAPAPNYPDTSGQWMGPAIAGGAGVFGSIGSAKIIVGSCISGNCRVETPNGTRRLAEIKPGDKVRTPSGTFATVLWKDFGLAPPGPRMPNLLSIHTPIRTIVLTADHLLHGLPASDWRVGDKIAGQVITEICIVPIRPVGDLLLEGGQDYVVEGFNVGSMLARMGFDAEQLRQIEQEARA